MAEGFKKATVSIIFFTLLIVATNLYSQLRTAYPDIPRVDVHTHIGNDTKAISNYLDLRKKMLKKSGIDMAIWVNLGKGSDPIEDPEKILATSKGRILSGISDYSAHDGLQHPPEDLEGLMKQGFVGYKIWSGPWYRKLKNKEDGFPYIDNPAHEPTFAEMERIGMIGASIHIADPNGPWGQRTAWLADPIEYWKEITAWRNVLEKHPNLTAVMAHGNWLMCQDAQIDYLRNMLHTFPNLHVDLAATFQYFHLVNRDNLRSFMIEWADRLLFATDNGAWENENSTNERVEQYLKAFQILETENIVQGGFFGGPDVKGLALPKDMLEKIYYKNAMRLYPGVKKQLSKLGFKTE